MLAIPFAFAIALLATLIHGQTETTLSPDDEVEWTNYGLTGRIVNGTKAALRQFPYQVSLRRSYNDRHFCGGSLINEYYVLTAAHCMYTDTGEVQAWAITVVAGQLELNHQSSSGQKRGLAKIHIHPYYNPETLQNDVALLTLKVPLTLTPEVSVASIADAAPVPDTICQVAGWGYPSEDYPAVTDHLMYVDLPLLSVATCRKLLDKQTDLPPGMYCAGYLEGQRDTCKGDSGSGMICNGKLTGVVSGGVGCARPALPGVYADVYHYRDWITTVASLSSAVTRNVSGSEKVLGTTLLPSILLSVLWYV